MKNEIINGEMENDPRIFELHSRFWVALLLTFAVFTLGRLEEYNLQRFMTETQAHILQMLLTTLIVFGAGLSFLRSGIRSLFKFHLNFVAFLTITILVMYFYQLAALAYPQMFSKNFFNEEGEIIHCFGAVAFLMTLLLFGRILFVKSRPEDINEEQA